MTQHITAAEAYANAKLAYEAGTLQAQVMMTGVPRYLFDGCRCAIGVSLNDATLARIEEDKINDLTVELLIKRGVISSDEPFALETLQASHDEWVMAANETWRRDLEAMFARELTFRLARLQEKKA